MLTRQRKAPLKIHLGMDPKPIEPYAKRSPLAQPIRQLAPSILSSPTPNLQSPQASSTADPQLPKPLLQDLRPIGRQETSQPARETGIHLFNTGNLLHNRNATRNPLLTAPGTLLPPTRLPPRRPRLLGTHRDPKRPDPRHTGRRSIPEPHQPLDPSPNRAEESFITSNLRSQNPNDSKDSTAQESRAPVPRPERAEGRDPREPRPGVQAGHAAAG